MHACERANSGAFSCRVGCRRIQSPLPLFNDYLLAHRAIHAYTTAHGEALAPPPSTLLWLPPAFRRVPQNVTHEEVEEATMFIPCPRGYPIHPPSPLPTCTNRDRGFRHTLLRTRAQSVYPCVTPLTNACLTAGGGCGGGSA